MYPFLEKRPLLKQVLEKIQEFELSKIAKRSVTIPEEFRFANRQQHKAPPPPINTPEEIFQFEAKSFTKFPVPRIKKKLEKEHIKNRERARLLLEEAQKVPERYFKTKKISIEEMQTGNKFFKAHKVPPKKEVEIKGNITSTLREASLLIKEQEDDIRRIEELVKGGHTGDKFEQLEMEEKQEQNRQQMEAIERKHLQGLLTYEEAILARKKLLESNKEKMLEFKEAHLELLDRLEKLREEEQEKIKVLVEKSQKIRQDAKESEKKLQEERQSQVRLQQYETKEMLRISYEEKQKELTRKMELIQEIRALQQIGREMRVKEFDPTECPNFGLLCEMSIAELQERLMLDKIRMTEELEEKRNCILKQKEQQQKMVENVKDFIAETRRMSKTKVVPFPEVKLERNPELVELKRQLQEKRNLRMQSTL